MKSVCVRLALAMIVAAGVAGSAACAASPAEGKVFYVATDGNDAWSGGLAEPNADKTDGPFATLRRARDAIRQLRQHGPRPAGGVVVELRGGIYQLPQPLELAAEDSGTEAAPVIYRARPGEEVRLTGGRVVAGFQPVTDPAVLARLDPSARGRVLQADLRAQGITDLGDVNQNRLEVFFQDKPMTLARWPNEGFVNIVGLVGGEPVDVRGTKGDKIGKFLYEGDRPKRWAGENDVRVHGYWFWDWSDQRHKVESIDTDKRIIAVAPPYHHYGYRVGQWFYAFNVLSEIDVPGEWYLDRQTGILYFWPPAPMEPGSVVVSLATSLLTLRDVSYVTFRGMIFEAARDSAITIQGGSHNRVAGCVLRNLGGRAVTISGGTAHAVVGCDLYDLGSGGIALHGGDRKTLTPAGLAAENNHIHHYGRWNRMYCPAIALDGVGNRAAHNLMHDAPHQAISFGGNDHCIELNEIHHVCLESNDAGAIYAGRDWTQRGTVIRHNFLHHVTGFRGHGCVGVYLDDMFAGTTIFGNVFYQVTRAAFIGGGRDNVVENNLFIDCTPALHIDARAMGWAADSVPNEMRRNLLAMPYQNDLWRSRYPKLVNVWEDEPAVPKGNVIVRNACQGGRWDEVEDKARPHVAFQDNLVADDLHLVDPIRMDFRLRDDSPVYIQVRGFQKIPFEQMGLVDDEHRASLPADPERVEVLNNLVSELMDAGKRGLLGRPEIRFVNPRRGWCFFRLSGPAKVRLDSQPPLVLEAQAGKTTEAMRHLLAGRHVLHVEGRPESLVVRAIPALVYNCYRTGTQIEPFGIQTWDVLQKHVAPQCNIIEGSGGRFPEEMAQWKAEGKVWVFWCGAPGLNRKEPVTAEAAYQHWRQNPGYTDPLAGGMQVDEFIPRFSDNDYLQFAQSVGRLAADPAFAGRWFIPFVVGTHRTAAGRQFVQAVREAGWPFSIEIYVPEKPTEQENLANLRKTLVKTAQEWDAAMPGCLQSAIVAPMYSALPYCTTNTLPSTDFKVHLDMQMEMLANDPVFAGLGGIQPYRSNYADPDTLCWMGKLLRHYAIEGRHQRLSQDPYELRHLANPDFDDGLAQWEIEPAEQGSIFAETYPSYGALTGRYPWSQPAGSRFLVMRRSLKQANRFSQTVKNLQPGRLYSLKMYTADYQELMRGKSRRALHPVSIRLEGVEVLPGEKHSFQHPFCNAAAAGPFDRENRLWMNFHWRVFRAQGPTARLTVSDWKDPKDPGGPAGQELACNFLELQPYCAEP